VQHHTIINLVWRIIMSVMQTYLTQLEQLRDEKEFALVKLRNEIANVKADIRKTKKMSLTDVKLDGKR
jgi:hypothetical protein